LAGPRWAGRQEFEGAGARHLRASEILAIRHTDPSQIASPRASCNREHSAGRVRMSCDSTSSGESGRCSFNRAVVGTFRLRGRVRHPRSRFEGRRHVVSWLKKIASLPPTICQSFPRAQEQAGRRRRARRTRPSDHPDAASRRSPFTRVTFERSASGTLSGLRTNAETAQPPKSARSATRRPALPVAP